MLRHVQHHVPVTALAYLGGDVILSGEGHLLRAYGTTIQRQLASIATFSRQAIHGIIIPQREAATFALVWGGSLIRSVKCLEASEGRLSLELGSLSVLDDWILDAAFSPGQYLALVTAHNALVVTHRSILNREAHPADDVLMPLVPGSNCILYSAHIQWLSASHCLITSGTAFGDVIVWSATISSQADGKLRAESQTHYTFSAHDGSVFGVRTSPPLSSSGDRKSLLATCSDDRSVRIWDISDLSAESPSMEQLQQETGFGAKQTVRQHSPNRVASAMGHTSRIWQVRFLPPNVSTQNVLQIMSFGEDASNIKWSLLSPTAASTVSTLRQDGVETAHQGKHIWSAAVSVDNSIATGGADGAVALRPIHRRQAITRKVDDTLFSGPSGTDNVKSYCFVDSKTLFATTAEGMMITLRIEDDDLPRVTEVSPPLTGLQKYSVSISVSGIAFAAGTEGVVYMYTHEHRRVFEIVKLGRKAAGLFADTAKRPNDQDEVCLLITSVGCTAATLLFLAPYLGPNIDLVPVLQQKWQFALPQTFVVTSFTQFAVEGCRSVALGARNGAICIFDIPSAHTSEAVEPSVTLPHLCAAEAVTSLHWMLDEWASSEGYLHCTKRDSTHAVYSLRNTELGWVAQLVHQLTLPFGPNIEGLSFRQKQRVCIWGFRSKHFIVYDVTAQREIMTVECGGAHRFWAFAPADEGGTLVWTKASQLFQQSQTKLAYNLISSGGHGREIKAAAVSSTTPQLIATGAEDTNIKLWSTSGEASLLCLQTLRKHNTGIQHLQWSNDGRYLFSSGGFEEFHVWAVTLDVPYIGVGVVCQSSHPRSGTSDLRIMSFDIEKQDEVEAAFTIVMVYSDSTLKRWSYNCENGDWRLLAEGDYLTACLTNVHTIDADSGKLMTAATDGNLSLWTSDNSSLALRWHTRHSVHQNAILIAITHTLPDGSIMAITGGDDNAIGITRISGAGSEPKTLLVSRAHAAAITGLVIVPAGEATLMLASAAIDQRVKLWRVDLDFAQPGVHGVDLKFLASASTAVADVSSLTMLRPEDQNARLLVCGVGMDIWTVGI
ncbi:hypothetical protein BAUCODRAFT_149649 [Baudoinia panamericana UAMH 10762]|uniref:Uncharacterized protein n=1 Tax=Baudoinia panamericana (strain UAMH 10762) TaxID=717646 RepID=M2LJX2_BAUPA|nr:uncharacterized protein BAUCODRAFT_149649 [Baudoinia panamericana UAMH 10762]EMC94507.1 hypothetical protein BAUCODRAFT_149649 [Baudoinia panamericana UAMH 10762]